MGRVGCRATYGSMTARASPYLSASAMANRLSSVSSSGQTLSAPRSSAIASRDSPGAEERVGERAVLDRSCLRGEQRTTPLGRRLPITSTNRVACAEVEGGGPKVRGHGQGGGERTPGSCGGLYDVRSAP